MLKTDITKLTSKEQATFHDKLVLDIIESESGVLQNEIIEATRISRTTVHDSLQRLLLSRKIIFSDEKTGMRGRPRRFYLSNTKFD